MITVDVEIKARWCARVTLKLLDAALFAEQTIRVLLKFDRRAAVPFLINCWAL